MRRVAIGVGAVVVVVAAVFAVALACRFRLASAVIGYGLSRAGFADARFTLERADRGAIVVSQMESGESLRVERCEITLDWRRLPRLPVDRVRVVGARIDLSKPSETSTPSTPDESASPASLPVGLVPALELDDALVTLASPLGPIAVQLDSRVEPENGALHMQLAGKASGKDLDAAFHGDARLDDRGAVSMTVELTALDARYGDSWIAGGAATATVTGQSAGIGLHDAKAVLDASLRDSALGTRRIGGVRLKVPAKLDRSGGGWTANVEGADLVLEREALHATAISGAISAKSAKLAIGSLEDISAARRFQPIAATAEVARGDPALEFSADIHAARGRVAVHAEGSYDASRRVALADVTLPKTMLGERGVRLADVSPLVAVEDAAGALGGVAHVHWSAAAGLSGDADLELAGISATSKQIRIEGLDGHVKLSSVFPPVTAGVQTLHVRELHPGVLFSDASLRFALEPAKSARGSRLRLERFETGFAGGRIVVDGAVLDPFAATNSIDFRVADVDAAALFAIGGIQGVSGTGRLSGTIPVSVRGRAVAIPEGKLVANGGVLQIQSPQIAALLAGGGQSVDLMLDALRDFHYDELTVEITKAFEGEASVAVHLAGQNPAVMEGQPFRINLNLSGNLDRLVASLLQVARLSDQAVRATVGAIHSEAPEPRR